MAECRKCKKSLETNWIVCPYCGTSVSPPKKSKKTRGNGTGTAYRRGSTWTAKVVVDWRKKVVDGKEYLVPVSKTKGGFAKKTDALNYCLTLKKSPTRIESNETFKQIYDRWVPIYEPRIKSTTMATYKAAFKHFAPIHYYKISTLTVADLQKCLDECKKGRSTKDDMKSVCSLVFKFAEQAGIVEKNLGPLLFVGRDKKGTREALSIDDLQLIAKSIEQVPYADYVYCLCYTGFRPNEFLSLKKTAYHEEKKGEKTFRFLIGGFKTEAGTDRAVTISPKIQPIIDRLLKSDSEFLFPNMETGKMMDDEFFRKKCFNPLMSKLGIDGKVPYSCRHTFANLLKNATGSDTDKAALIGHADASMTKYYQSADYEAMTAITDAL